MSFKTLVYDTNVGDISPIMSYFNPQRISEYDLNTKYGQSTTGRINDPEPIKIGTETTVMPKLLIYPLIPPPIHLPPPPLCLEQDVSVEESKVVEVQPKAVLLPLNPDQVEVFMSGEEEEKVQRTLDWVINQDEKAPDEVSTPSVTSSAAAEELSNIDTTSESSRPSCSKETDLDSLGDPILDLDCLSLGQALEASWQNETLSYPTQSTTPPPTLMPKSFTFPSMGLSDMLDRVDLDIFDSWRTSSTSASLLSELYSVPW